MKVLWLMHERGMRGTAAHQRGVVRSVDTEAEKIGAKAKARLAVVQSTGKHSEGNAEIEVKHRLPGQFGDIDSEVHLVDNPHVRKDGSVSKGNAMAIEFGHINNWTGKYNEGKYILTGAAGLV